ncbi:MAG: WcaI family glycosyltransferase [Winogradskyella sp.]|nr:WcaI family glycosyltransferase [Winogradskyella sp.]
MSKITLISAYFYPEDTAIGLYNTQMVKALESNGHEVSVITGFPCYPQWEIWDAYKTKPTFFSEYIGKTKVYRYKQYVPKTPSFLKRIVLLLDFTMGSFFNVFKIKDCDIVISVVPHSSTMLLGWILKKRKSAKLWHHVQDFEFDAAKQSGISKRTNIVSNTFYGLLFKIESFLLNRADINSTISYKMIEKLEQKSSVATFYFPNWIDADKIDPAKSHTHPYLTAKTLKILYSGNIGDKQDWNFFIAFAEALKDKDAEIIIVGDGAKKEWLCKNIEGLDNTTYYPPVEYNELNDLLCSADLHVLFQKDDVVDSVMPSKLLGMMASATPSLITGNAESEVKKILDESQGGLYISDQNLEKCVAYVDHLMSSKTTSVATGEKARDYIIDKFSINKVLPSFMSKLKAI